MSPLRRSSRLNPKASNFVSFEPTPVQTPTPATPAILGVDPVTGEPYREWQCRSTERKPRFDLLKEGETIAIDGEFVQYKFIGDADFERYWGRVTAVGEDLQTLYDIYANYKHVPGTEMQYDPPKFGVSPEDLLFENGAEQGSVVEKNLKALVKGRQVVFHDRKGDMKANVYEKDMFTESNGVTVHDTQDIFRYVKNTEQGPSLAHCADGILRKTMRTKKDEQSGLKEHNPVEDARVTMELFLWERKRKRDEEEADKGEKPVQSEGSPSKRPKIAKKKGGKKQYKPLDLSK